MPIYEYVCHSCGHHKEVLQKASDAPLLDCVECGQSALKKKISSTSFRLKGAGWYETDFKGQSKAPQAKADQSADKPGTSDDTKNTKASKSESSTTTTSKGDD